MRFLLADKVFNGRQMLEKGSVLVLDMQNLLKDVVSISSLDENKVEKFNGVITPGFVNAHCHLELSHMKGIVPMRTGLVDFGKAIISKRNSVSREKILEAIDEGDREMYANGIVAVGDICNTPDTFIQKQNSPIYYHSFVELIGLNPLVCDAVFEAGVGLLKELQLIGLSGSLAPHAPYSVSLQLIEKISAFDCKNNLPVSIHNQETNEENLFFMGEKSQISELYSFLNIDISWFRAPGIKSLQAIASGLDGKPVILVHNTISERDDLKSLSGKPVFWCFCPAANLYIEDRLPKFNLFSGQKICIGTDSLASNLKLDIVQEINLICEASDVFTLEELLEAATFSGASAIGAADKFGSLIKGKNTGLNLLQEDGKKLKFIKKIC